MRWLRLALVNGLIFAGIWILALVAILAVTDIRRSLERPSHPDEDLQAALPNQPDPALSRRINIDFHAGNHVYVPFIEWRHAPQTSPTLHVDSERRRVHAVGKTNRPDATSIGFFGGSAMWGTGVADDQTIPAIFDTLSDGFNVANYGEIAWTSRQSVAQLINLISQNRMPKVVVFYDGYNDVGLLCDRGITDSLNSTAKDISMRAKMSEREKHDGLYVNLVAPIVELAIEVNQSDIGANQFSCGKNQERAEQVAETMVRNWEIARTLVEANGGRFFAFLQPNAFFGHPRTDYMPDGVSERWQIRQQATPDFTAVYPLIQAKLAARASTWATDVTDAFDGNEMFYIDSVHVVPKGNAIIAKRMFERITHATQQAAN